MQITKIAGSLGAEISDINLCSQLTTVEYQQIREALVKHQVIFFRRQDINHEQLRNLATFFGPVQSHPAYDTVEGYSEITILESTAEKPTKIECWHTDMTFRQHPPMITVLRSKIIPPWGGDTLWSSMSVAYNALSEPMKQYLNDMQAVHDFRRGFKESLEEEGGVERLKDAVSANPPVTHPVIRIHPESQLKVIFVNQLFTTHIVGIPSTESNAILNFLYEHVTKPEFTCRFNWDKNCIAMWDNRSTQHKPINDYFPQHRRLERITIDGDKPY